MRTVNRILALLIAVALGAIAVLIIVETISYHLNSQRPVLIDFRPWAEWAEQTTWSSRPLAIGGIGIAAIALIWLLLELTPGRLTTFDSKGSTPGVRTVYTRRGLQHAVASAAASVDGVRDAHISMRRRRVAVSAIAAAREPAAANELRPAVLQAAQQRIDDFQLVRPLRVTARVVTARR